MLHRQFAHDIALYERSRNDEKSDEEREEVSRQILVPGESLTVICPHCNQPNTQPLYVCVKCGNLLSRSAKDFKFTVMEQTATYSAESAQEIGPMNLVIETPRHRVSVRLLVPVSLLIVVCLIDGLLTWLVFSLFR